MTKKRTIILGGVDVEFMYVSDGEKTHGTIFLM